MIPKNVFATAHAFTQQWEGGLVNHPADPGGLTNYGISLRFLKSIGHDVDGDGDVDAADILALTCDTAAALFKEHFFVRPNLFDFPLFTAIATYDAGVNAGLGRAVRFVQSACNFYPGDCLAVDGRLGPKTRARIAAIAGHGKSDLALALRAIKARRDFYVALAQSKPALAVFLKGWLNRVAALETYIKDLAAAVAA